jgi:Protein of unknown function (DUF2794)
LSESEPIPFRPRAAGASRKSRSDSAERRSTPIVAFQRPELDAILAVYARKVAAGEWRDYALEMGRERATFSIFRRASEFPLFRIEKNPRLARRQGTYSVVAAGGMILKRGHELGRVLAVLDSPRLVRR